MVSLCAQNDPPVLIEATPVNKPNRFNQFVVKSPLLWGGLASVGFYGILHSWFPALRPIFADHWIEYTEAILFFIGLAALVLRLFDLAAQRQAVGRPILGPHPATGIIEADCQVLLGRLERVATGTTTDYLPRRLHDALEHVRRRGSAAGLDETLRYLSDLDLARAHASYALVRVIIWAIPILGFLGTVVGITMAIGGLAPEALEQSLPAVMANLAIAFNTTIEALILSIILMFAQYIADKVEGNLLAAVDEQVEAELVGRFDQLGESSEGQLRAVRRMIEGVLQSNEQLVHRQAEIWRMTVDAAQETSGEMLVRAGQQLQSALSAGLHEALEAHARHLSAQEQAVTERSRHALETVEQMLARNAQAMASLENAITRQVGALTRASDAAEQIERLEAALNQNLQALAGSHHFEQTVMSLAATINLLNARLTGAAPTVKLDFGKKAGQAA